jgi:cell division protein FtsX
LIRVHEDAALAEVNAALQQLTDQAVLRLNLSPEAIASLSGAKVMDIQLARLRDAYFDRDLVTDAHSLPVDRGDRRVVAGLVVVAVLILALAAMNYVNLATIRVIRRQREIGLRKVLGWGRRRLALQFVAESLLVSLMATLVGLVLAVLALPGFSRLVDRNLASLLSLDNLAAALGVGVILGLAVAIYPAWIALRVSPSQVLAGRPNTESMSARRLRQSLSVLQVATAMGLASITLCVAMQTRYAIDASPGFDPAPLLVFEMNEGRKLGQDEVTRGFVAELSQQPGVAGIALATDAVGRTRNPWGGEFKRAGGQGVNIEVKEISPQFFEEYGIRPAAGRLFNAKDKEADDELLVINAIAARQLGFATPQQAIGETVLYRMQLKPGVTPKRIIGIAPEVRFRSLREAPGPIAYQLWPGGVTVTVRASGSVPDAARAVRRVWGKYFPQSVLDMSPAKDIYVANYADDARLAGLLGLATVIAMLIAAFGAYVLAADAVQRRTREIALRKLFGARRRDVARLVAKEIGVMVLMSALIALPVAALVIARYLASFTERTPFAYWTLALALTAALGVIGFAAARQAWLAMRLKPAVALRS